MAKRKKSISLSLDAKFIIASFRRFGSIRRAYHCPKRDPGGKWNAGRNDARVAHAFLHGTRHIGATTVEGTVSPGNSIGTLTVHGDYVQLHASTYEVEIDPGGASDQVIVTDLAVRANLSWKF